MSNLLANKATVGIIGCRRAVTHPRLAKRDRANPRQHLSLTRIVDGHPNSRLDELLPWTYPATPNRKAVA